MIRIERALETKAIPMLIWWELKLFNKFLSQASNWVKCCFLGGCVFCILSRAFSRFGMFVFLIIMPYLNWLGLSKTSANFSMICWNFKMKVSEMILQPKLVVMPVNLDAWMICFIPLVHDSMRDLFLYEKNIILCSLVCTAKLFVSSCFLTNCWHSWSAVDLSPK